MKYGKVLTYKDIEEAKKLIGKKVVASAFLDIIETNPEHLKLETLCGVNSSNFLCYVNDHTSICYQFIREVIEEPQYRPFKNVAELIEYWEKNYDNGNRPNGTMPLIWIKHKNNSLCFLITRFETSKNSVCISESTQWFNLENMFEFYEFLDGKPCGVEVEE